MEPLWMMAAYHHRWNSVTGKDIHRLNGYTSIYLTETFKGTKQIPTQIPTAYQVLLEPRHLTIPKQSTGMLGCLLIQGNQHQTAGGEI